MFKVVLTTLFIISSAAVQPVAEFLFTDGTTRKFGKTPEGEVLYFYYPFTNKGKAPLVITDTKAECTCTVVEYPLKPVAPGASDTIFVSFDTKGKIGYQDRIVEVYSNTKKNPTKLRFKVNVDNKHPKK